MIYYYIWPDKTISFVNATDKEHAQYILDDIGEIGTAELKHIEEFVEDFFVTFKTKPKKYKGDPEIYLEIIADEDGFLDGLIGLVEEEKYKLGFTKKMEK